MKDAGINLVLGQRVRQLRFEKGITREFLAEQVDVSSRFLANVECGSVGVSLATLKRLCVYFGVSADYLLGITEHPNDNPALGELVARINRMDAIYEPYINDIITAFSKAVEARKDK